MISIRKKIRVHLHDDGVANDNDASHSAKTLLIIFNNFILHCMYTGGHNMAVVTI